MYSGYGGYNSYSGGGRSAGRGFRRGSGGRGQSFSQGGFFHGGSHNFGNRHYDSGPGCMFCTGVSESEESHMRRHCAVFRQLKANITTRPYVEVKLRDNDEKGFAAAGFLLWKRVNGEPEFLMAREFRDGYDKLNFLGGKRLRKQESSIEVALRKVDIESGGKLLRKTLEDMKQPPIVHWGAPSKYALFLYEVSSWIDCEVDVNCAGLAKEGLMRLEWVSFKGLNSARFVQSELHDFATDMVHDLEDPSCNVLRCIEELFDTAKVARDKTSSSSVSENTSFDFDSLNALMSAAGTARGFRSNEKITWGTIQDAVGSLHKSDIRKLKLRFHPDRLIKQLLRDPSDLEMKTGTKAMQVLNQIFDMVNDPDKAPTRSSCTGGVFNTLTELREFIKQYEGGEDSDDTVVAAMSAKLAEIKLK